MSGEDTLMIVDGKVAQVWRGHEPSAATPGFLVKMKAGRACCGMLWRDGVLMDPERTPAPKAVNHVEYGGTRGGQMPTEQPMLPTYALPDPVAQAPSPTTINNKITVGGGMSTSLPAAQGAAPVGASHAVAAPHSNGGGHASVPRLTEPHLGAVGGVAKPASPAPAAPPHSILAAAGWSQDKEVIFEACQRAMNGHEASIRFIGARAAALGVSIEEYAATVMIERANAHAAVLEEI